MKRICLLALVIIAVLIPVAARAAPVPEPDWNPGAHFRLVFDSEFNGTSVDSQWNTGWYGTGITGPVNSNETVRYSSANVSESGGFLRLALGRHYGSLVDTNGKFSLRYGRVEVRACLPSSRGAVADWPAIWLDGQPVWPSNGEIDIAEGLGGTLAAHTATPPPEDPDLAVPGSFTGCHDLAFTGCRVRSALWRWEAL